MKRKIKRYDIQRAHDDWLLRRYEREERHHKRLMRKAFNLARHARSIGRMDHLLTIAKHHNDRAQRAHMIVWGVKQRRARGS